MEKIYTPTQLSERWGCSTRTVREAISAGILPAFRVGRLMRVPRSAVHHFEQRF